MSITQEAIKEARDLVGVWLPRMPHNTRVTRPAIARWAKAIGDRNPLWLEEEYARGSIHGSLVTPPCWLYSVDDTLIAPSLPGLHAIYAGTQWQFHRLLHPGEQVQARARLLEVREKEGRFCGPMALQVGEVIYTDIQGGMVARAVSKTLRTSREDAVARGKYGGWTKYRYNRDELFAIEDAYDAEEIRGFTPRRWEDVSPGEGLTPIVRGPLTSEEISQFVCATRPAMNMKEFLKYRRAHPEAAFRDPETGMWESWEASMIRDDVAQMFGFPFAHDAGIDRISWVGNLITNWMGDEGFLKELSVDLLLPNIYGDTTWCMGQVREKARRGGESLVELDVWCDNQRGQRTAAGRALVSLPTQ
jgi:acyl dehydratase